MAFGGRRRDHADTNIAFDESTDGIEAAQLDAKFKAPAYPLCLLGQEALQRAHPVETDKIEVEGVGKRNLFCRRQWVGGGDDEYEAVDAKRHHLEARHLDCAGDDPDIGG